MDSKPVKLWQNLKNLLNMKEEEVDKFLRSYHIFHKETCSEGDEKYVIDYYNVLNYLCACGEVEKMYIPPVIDMKLGIFDNQVEYEKIICKHIGAKEGMHILDIGCGRGAVAAHICKISGAKVTGFNIDPTQLKLAKENAEKIGLSDKLTFFNASYNDRFPFEDNTFDAAYDIQAFSYALSYDHLFKEVFRVLKPGAKISMLEWVKYKLDLNDKSQYDLYHNCKELIGAVYTPSTDDFVGYMEGAGLKVLVNENASIDGFQYQLIQKAMWFFTSLEAILRFFQKINLIPAFIITLFERLNKYGEAFFEGDKRGLWTSCHQFTAQKPL